MMRRSFSVTMGVLLAMLLVGAALGAVLLAIAGVHDYIVSREYDAHPSLSKDNRWGSLWVSASITKRDKEDPIATHSESCYRMGRFVATFRGVQGDTSDPKCTYTVPAIPGSSRITGTLRLKNRLWLKSVRVSASMVKAQFGSKITSTSAPNLDGRVLDPGKGLSNQFEASFGESKDGTVVLSANGRNLALH
jgi:hypothetical protein